MTTQTGKVLLVIGALAAGFNWLAYTSRDRANSAAHDRRKPKAIVLASDLPSSSFLSRKSKANRRPLSLAVGGPAVNTSARAAMIRPAKAPFSRR